MRNVRKKDAKSEDDPDTYSVKSYDRFIRRFKSCITE